MSSDSNRYCARCRADLSLDSPTLSNADAGSSAAGVAAPLASNTVVPVAANGSNAPAVDDTELVITDSLLKSSYDEKKLADIAVRLRANDPSMEDLDLFAEGIGPEGLEVIADALESNTTVVLCFLGMNRLGDAGAVRLARIMAKHPRMSSIFLRDNDIGSRGSIAVCHALLSPHSRVTELFYGYHFLDAECTQLMAQVIRKNRRLRLLDLDGCGLGDAGVQVIAEALAENKGLTELHIANNSLTDVGGMALAKAIQKHSTLTRCTIESSNQERNSISQEVLKLIYDRLMVNSSRPAKEAFLLGSVVRPAAAPVRRSFFQHPLFHRSVLSTILKMAESPDTTISRYDTMLADTEEDGDDDSGDEDQDVRMSAGARTPLSVPSLVKAGLATAGRAASDSGNGVAPMVSSDSPRPPASTAGRARSPGAPRAAVNGAGAANGAVADDDGFRGSKRLRL